MSGRDVAVSSRVGIGDYSWIELLLYGLMKAHPNTWPAVGRGGARHCTVAWQFDKLYI